MAIINPSALISEIRGNVGNISFARNRSGPFVRKAIDQVNPDTVYQQAVREALRQAVIDWQAATDEYREEFDEFVIDRFEIGRLSRKVRQSAFNEFLRRQLNRFVVDASPVYTPALPTVRKFPVIVSVASGVNNLSVTFDSNGETPFSSIAVYASALMSPGIRAVNPAWCKLIKAEEHFAKDGTIEFFEEYINRLPYVGDPNGKRLFIAIRAVNNDNYSGGVMQFSSLLVSGWPVLFDTFDSTFDETFF